MIQRWFEPFTLLEKTAVPAGMGGESITYTPSLDFQGALTFTAGDEISMAGQAVLREGMALLHEFDVTLAPGDHVRREKDGAVYRVQGRSEDLRSPAFSGLQFAQVPVERLVIPC